MPAIATPDLWLPPRPAIIRPAEFVGASFLPGMFPGAAGNIASFPSIVGVVGSTDDTFASSHNLAYPGGTTAAGELLIAVLRVGGGLSSDPSGWSRLPGTGTNTIDAALYKIATGSEGASLTVTTGANGWCAGSLYRISRYSGAPEGNIAAGSSASPDPPSLTASWGTGKTLWIAACGAGKTIGSPGVQVSGFPSGFGNTVSAAANAGGGGASVCAGAASLADDTTDTKDPGSFSLNGSNSWAAYTIAVHGS